MFLFVSVWAAAINKLLQFAWFGRLLFEETLEFFDTQTLNSEAKKVDAEEELYIKRIEVKGL